MAFEMFSKRAAGKLKQPTLTVQKRGTLSTNSATAMLISGGEFPEKDLPVELFYDKERNAIGIRKAASIHPNVYQMRKQRKSDSFLIAGKAFTQYYGIITGEARRYNVKDFGDGIFGAELGGEFAEVTRDREDEEETD